MASKEQRQQLQRLPQRPEPQQTPVRQLSLGQRMRGDLAAALKDHPAVAAYNLLNEPAPELKAKALTHYSAKWPWARTEGREILRLSYPADLEPTAPQALADASLLTGVPIEAGQVAAFASVEWSAMPARIDPSTQIGRASCRERVSSPV